MKLTKAARQDAKLALQKKIEAAIEQAPKGLTDGEIRHAILAAATSQGVVK